MRRCSLFIKEGLCGCSCRGEEVWEIPASLTYSYQLQLKHQVLLAPKLPLFVGARQACVTTDKQPITFWSVAVQQGNAVAILSSARSH